MPLSIKLHGDALKGITIARGLVEVDVVPVKYIAITSMLFESVDSFMEAFTPHAAVLQGDMKNYTNIEPVIQFNEIIMG